MSARRLVQSTILITTGALWLGCSDTQPPSATGDNGGVSFSLAVSSEAYDVASVQFTVVGDDDHSQSAILPIGEEGLPTGASAADGRRQFAAWFVVLNEGTYRVHADPLKADGSPSGQCAPVSGLASVHEGMTTEVLLVSNCQLSGSGAVTATVFLNGPPFIEEVTVEPSQYVCVGEPVALSVVVGDPDGDEISLAWSAPGLPEQDATYALIPGVGGLTAEFVAQTPGLYNLSLEASDDRMVASLAIPVYVRQQCGPICGAERCSDPEQICGINEAGEIACADDPCGELTYDGQCDGDIAQRCSRPEEGPRRPLETDCSVMGLTCGVDVTGTVACVDPELG